jgi:hypothetical protein
MPNDWNFVDSWLDDVLSFQRLETSTPQMPAFINHGDAITRIAQQAAPPSPPPSNWPERPSYTPPSGSKHPSLKRKHRACFDNDNIMSSPRKRQKTQSDQRSITTVTPVLSDIQLPPTRPSSPTKVKAESPVRELRDIYRYAKPPLKYTTSVDENTPQSVVDMIRGLPLHGVNVIPGFLKVGLSSCSRTRALRQMMTDTSRKPFKQPCLLKIFPTTPFRPRHRTTGPPTRISGKQPQIYLRERSPVS